MNAMDEPIFSVVKGSPTDDELAAVITVLTTLQRTGSATGGETPRPSGWSAYWRSVRPVVARGPGAWRMSGRPQ
jgi:hypothetical protein